MSCDFHEAEIMDGIAESSHKKLNLQQNTKVTEFGNIWIKSRDAHIK